MPLHPVANGLEARILRQAEAARAEIAAFCGDLIRVPTVNPPGENYRECAALLGDRLAAAGFEVTVRRSSRVGLPARFRGVSPAERHRPAGESAGSGRPAGST